MNVFIEVIVFIFLIVVAWVLVEISLQKTKQRQLAEEMVERRRKARMNEILYGSINGDSND